MNAFDTTRDTGGIAILGGSFNPLHIGHLRLAMEIREALDEHISRVDLVTAARPPHKEERHMLPFAMRASLVREAVAPYYPWLRCSMVEGERPLPSYTWDTLGVYAERWPRRELFFTLGIEDYANLPYWRNGLRVLERCSLVVVPRGVYHEGDFENLTLRLWPDAQVDTPLATNGLCMRVGDARVLFQPVPWIPVSASLIRERWLSGRCIDFLAPRCVVALLERHKDEVIRFWS